jgi:CubicO group peptidase (beta-lactamase class C family)
MSGVPMASPVENLYLWTTADGGPESGRPRGSDPGCVATGSFCGQVLAKLYGVSGASAARPGRAEQSSASRVETLTFGAFRNGDPFGAPISLQGGEVLALCECLDAEALNASPVSKQDCASSSTKVVSACLATKACPVVPPELSASCRTTSSFVVSGESVINGFAVDLRIAEYMAQYSIPNGAVAIVADGRLVYAKGFTNCAAYDESRAQPFMAGPHTKFRIASVSKVLSATAALKLFDLGLLPDFLHTKVASFVNLEAVPPHPFVRMTPDPRLSSLNLFHLLTHTGGWLEADIEDEESDGVVDGVYPPVSTSAAGLAPIGGNINAQYDLIAQLFGTNFPLSKEMHLRFGNGMPLSFDPGTHYRYSPYGYWLLGRLIEGITCRSYESFVLEHIVKPLGMRNTEMGDSELSRRRIDEVPYFSELWPWQSGSERQSVMQSSPYESGPLAYTPYAYRDMRMYDSTGGWISSAYDLALFMREMCNSSPSVLQPSTMRRMFSPRVPTSAEEGYMCLGWNTDGRDFWKTGHFEGTQAWVYRRMSARLQNVAVIYLFNRYWAAFDDSAEPTFRANIIDALQAVSSWGGRDDLFSSL